MYHEKNLQTPNGMKIRCKDCKDKAMNMTKQTVDMHKEKLIRYDKYGMLYRFYKVIR